MLRAGIVVAVVMGLAFTRPSWGGRAPAGDDVLAHVIRADYAFSHLFAHGRLDGWFPRFMVGHQEFLFYGPGFTWLLGLIRLATAGALSTVGAYKVAGILTFVAFGPAMAFVATSLGLTRRAAAVVAILALAVNSDLGVGLHAVYSISLVPQQLGAIAFCVALGCLVRTVVDSHRRWTVIGALALVAIAVTHLITGMVLLLIGAIALVPLLVATPGRGRACMRLAGMASAAIGLSAFWLAPFLAHHDLRGPVTTWATPPFGARLSEIFHGRMLFAPGLAWFVAAGMLAWVAWPALRRGLGPLAWFVAAAPIVYLVAAHWAASTWRGNEVTLQLANRGLGYAGALAILPLAALIAKAPDWVALPVAAVAAVVYTGHARHEVGQAGRPEPGIVAAAGRLRHLVPDGARFATERDFPAEIARTGVSHPDLWLAQHSGRDTLNLFNAESSPSAAGFEAESIGKVPPDQLADRLERYGVTTVVTVRPTTEPGLLASGRFVERWRGGGLAILGLVRHTPAPRQMGDAEHVAATPASDGSFPLSWSPKWHARGAHLTESPDGLLRLVGPGNRRSVVLTFRRDRWDLAGALTSVAAAVAAGLYLLSSSSWMSRRRSRTA